MNKEQILELENDLEQIENKLSEVLMDMGTIVAFKSMEKENQIQNAMDLIYKGYEEISKVSWELKAIK